jgi:hypothetical protein
VFVFDADPQVRDLTLTDRLVGVALPILHLAPGHAAWSAHSIRLHSFSHVLTPVLDRRHDSADRELGGRSQLGFRAQRRSKRAANELTRCPHSQSMRRTPTGRRSRSCRRTCPHLPLQAREVRSATYSPLTGRRPAQHSALRPDLLLVAPVLHRVAEATRLQFSSRSHRPTGRDAHHPRSS